MLGQARATVDPGVVAVADHEEAGAAIWWTLSGDVTLSALRAAWEEAGLPADKLPNPIGRATALRIAVQEQASKRRLARPIGRDEGWYLVDETVVNKDEPTWRPQYRAMIADAGLVVERCQDGQWVPAAGDAGGDVAASIQAAYDEAQTLLPHGDLSSWLIRMVGRWHAVRLRETGGIYFVPKGAVAHWRCVARVLRACSGHRLYELPALKSEEAVEAILAAVMAEAEAAQAELSADLAAGRYGARGLQRRADRCNLVADKVARYGVLLDRNVDGVAAQLQALQAALVAAALVAEQDEE